MAVSNFRTIQSEYLKRQQSSFNELEDWLQSQLPSDGWCECNCNPFQMGDRYFGQYYCLSCGKAVACSSIGAKHNAVVIVDGRFFCKRHMLDYGRWVNSSE